MPIVKWPIIGAPLVCSDYFGCCCSWSDFNWFMERVL